MTSMAIRKDVTFTSGADVLAAWWYSGGPGRRPCVVMAHGFGGTKQSGLAPYAERFAEAGLHVLVLDYRHFGASGGQPRQLIHPRRQVEDVLAAARHARSRDDVDPARVALWGTSFGGGIVLSAAIRDGAVAAVVSQCPAVDGWAAGLQGLTGSGMTHRSQLVFVGRMLGDLVAGALGRAPWYIPVVGPPGAAAVMTAPDAEPGYRRIAGPDWVNAVCARTAVAVLRYRPISIAEQVPCPWLVQICDRDTVAPPRSTMDAARRAGARARVRHYDLGHFDIYVDEGFAQSVHDQLDFLEAQLVQSPTGA